MLTHASILTLTSNPTRTSPVKRGKWILDNILGTPPPEPPANVPPLEDAQEASPHATLREQMELHRKVPPDSPRVMQLPINAAGELPSGERFSGPAQLVTLLGKRQQQFSRALARKMLTYALGRGLKPYDQCAVDEIVKNLQEKDYRFSVLVEGVVTSIPFRMQRVAKEEG